MLQKVFQRRQKIKWTYKDYLKYFKSILYDLISNNYENRELTPLESKEFKEGRKRRKGTRRREPENLNSYSEKNINFLNQELFAYKQIKRTTKAFYNPKH